MNGAVVVAASANFGVYGSLVLGVLDEAGIFDAPWYVVIAPAWSVIVGIMLYVFISIVMEAMRDGA